MMHTQRRPTETLRFSLALLVVTFLLLVSGCSNPEPEPEPEVTTEAPPEPEPEEPPAPSVFWPLTGVAVEDSDGALDAEGEFGPALSVKIENSPAARPQEGLEAADIVWEELVEGGMTRFVAMYHSDLPPTLGPVRSLRPMDAAIAGPLGGVLAYSGGQLEYQARAQQAGLTIASHDGGHAGFYFNPERSDSHRLFADAEELLQHADGQDAAPALFTFAEEGQDPSALAGEEVRGVDLTFPASQPSWEWDGSVWQRFESGEPAVAVGGEHLRADNVIVVRVQLWDTGARDSAGSAVLESILTGEGPLTVFTGGHMVEGTWTKDGDRDPMIFTDLDGEEITLAPGNTWVELLPVTGGMFLHEAP